MMGSLATPLLLLGLAGISAACVNLAPKPDPSRFFTLAPLVPEERGTNGSRSPTDPVALGVGPIEFPGYLDRNQLITRISENRFAVAENEFWGEPLQDNFGRVLTQDLRLLLANGRVTRFPWPSTDRPTYQVEIDVLRFESDTAQRAQLVARWILRDVATREALSVKESRLDRLAKGRSVEESVVNLSDLLAEFSSEIADATRRIRRRS